MQRLFIFSGLPGSGKSTLSKKYAGKHSLLLLSVDPVEGAMKLNGIENNHSLGVAAYDIVKTIADQSLELGHTVVIDAVNPVEQARNIWRKLAKKHDVDLLIIECVVNDESEHRKRIEARVRNIPGYSEIKWSRVLERKKEYQPWVDDRLVVPTDESLEDSFSKVEEHLI